MSELNGDQDDQAQDDQVEDQQYQEEASSGSRMFTPSLPHSPLRAKVSSSGYGSKTAKLPDRPTERHWEEPQAYEPALPKSALREKAAGSGYGKVLPPVPVTPVEEVPTYVMKLPPSKLRESSSGSSYGKVVPKVEVKAFVPEHSFTPELPPSKLRAACPSSSYGKILPPKAEPRVSTDTDFKLDCVAFAVTPKKTLVHQILKDVDDETVRRSRSMSPIRSASAKGVRLRSEASSSRYGSVVPKPAQKPSVPVSEPTTPIKTKTPLADKVSSSGYGRVPPPKSEKHVPPPSEPSWSRTLVPETTTFPLPEPVKPAKYTDVKPTGYGKMSPPKGVKKEYVAGPQWAPTSVTVKLPAPAPAKSTKYDHVSSSGYMSASYTAGQQQDAVEADDETF
eukprot:m.542815 g.542815  ORF g.542815 m.542815 type:complete len:393 (+) comp57661_c0_seq1:127-1305(+)